MKYSKLGSLEKQKKRKASEWKFKGRAGDKAHRLRKVGHEISMEYFQLINIHNLQVAAQVISLKKTTQEYHKTAPGMKPLLFFHTSPLF